MNYHEWGDEIRLAYFNRRDRNGRTALHDSCRDGQASIKYISCLLERGIDVHAKDHNGLTALDYAFLNGHVNVISLLVNAKDKYGQTALHVACEADKASIESISLLLKAGADVHARDRRGKSALEYACNQGHANLIFPLVKAGADVKARDRWGRTALHRACYMGHPKLIPLLVEAGANVNAKAIVFGTALDVAIARYSGSRSEKLCKRLIQALVNAGCDVAENIQNPEVANALADYAARRADTQAALEETDFQHRTGVRDLLDLLFRKN